MKLKPILQLSNVCKRVSVGSQSITILKNINLEIHEGSMVAIVGPSGSGKSTLMNILGCLDQPSTGEYSAAGRYTDSFSPDELAHLRNDYFGFIFQKYHLLGGLSALENVEIPAIYAGISSADRRQRAIELLTTLGLSDRMDHRPNQLSGGQQQRVSIARALLNGGNVILADEPTGALDSDSGKEVMQIFHYLHELGHTIIIVTHDMEVASNAERILEIHDGMIVGDRPNIQKAGRGIYLKNIPTDRRTQPLNTAQTPLTRLPEAFRMARLALGSQRLRTVLTMLGIIIGIASVVSIMAIGEGQQRHMKEVIGPLTANKIEIRRGTGWADSGAEGVHSLVAADVDLLREQAYIVNASPTTQVQSVVRFGDVSLSATVSNVGEGFFEVSGITVAEGRPFRLEDIQNKAQVVVIDQETRRKLFEPGTDAVGEVVIIGVVPCTVIGVISDKSKDLLPASGANVLLPYTTAAVRLFGYQYLDRIMVRIREGQNSVYAEKNITRLLLIRHRIKDFFTSNKDGLTKAYQETTRSLSLTLVLVASITLLVGGIGVMNIMLVSVTERTREIGIRMAVGARRSDIMTQFLVEAVMICLMGGVLGIILSFLSGYVFSAFVKEWKMIFSTSGIVLAFMFSTLIGMTFGFMPARKASLLSPHEALSQD